jgi:hypothetical protein
MFHYLEQLRKKPEAERRKSAFLVSLSVTLIIAVVWSAVLVVRIHHMDFSLQKDPRADSVPSLSDTFSAFGERIQSIFSSGQTYEAPPANQ